MNDLRETSVAAMQEVTSTTEPGKIFVHYAALLYYVNRME